MTCFISRCDSQPFISPLYTYEILLHSLLNLQQWVILMSRAEAGNMQLEPKAFIFSPGFFITQPPIIQFPDFQFPEET